MGKQKAQRPPLFRPVDIGNLRWFWQLSLRDKTPWLRAVLAMVSLQGFVCQQCLAVTQNGPRVIFDNRSHAELIRVCIIAFLLFSARALISYVVPKGSLADDVVVTLKTRPGLRDRAGRVKQIIARMIGFIETYEEKIGDPDAA